ncbi:MAG: hypothetical protein ABSG41_28860 [Bryobacteraceae bacterium]|jgi:hypothetical protein
MHLYGFHAVLDEAERLTMRSGFTNPHGPVAPACVRGNSQKMTCNVRQRLSGEYDLRLRARARNEEALHSLTDTASARDYQNLKALANESRIDSEMARLELERHVEQHGCGHHAN